MKKLIFLILFGGLVFAKVAPISKGVTEITFKKDGKTYTIKRENSTIPKKYQRPLIGMIAPMKISDKIETIGELELLEYLKKSENDSDIILVDARTPNWYESVRIPSAINVPYTNFNSEENALEALSFEFNVEKGKDGKLDFSKAKTLLIYCNGAWCGQSLEMIKNAKYSLLKLGYPEDKIKYYRGGIQSWVTLGLTVEGELKDKGNSNK